MNFREEIDKMVEDRDTHLAAVREIDARLQSAKAAIQALKFLTPEIVSVVEPAPRKHRKTRSDLGVPRKVVDKEAVTPLDPLDQMIRDAAAFNRPEHRATTEAGDAV